MMQLEPYIGVQRIGIGNGARVAAVVGTRCRGTISGFALLSYPLEVLIMLVVKLVDLLCNNDQVCLRAGT